MSLTLGRERTHFGYIVLDFVLNIDPSIIVLRGIPLDEIVKHKQALTLD